MPLSVIWLLLLTSLAALSSLRVVFTVPSDKSASLTISLCVKEVLALLAVSVLFAVSMVKRSPRAFIQQYNTLNC